jgi:CRP/FNR family transcriptional regulator, cyclic AMP receptor protein
VAKSADFKFLREVLLFKDLAEEEEAAVWARLEERRLRRGDVLFREGDAGKELFFIRSGTVIVSKHVKGRVEQVLARLGPGDFFGEMSLFDDQPRSATIQAESETVMYGLDRSNLDHLIEQNPRAATAFFTQVVLVLIKRLRDSSELVAEVTRWGLEATGLDVERPVTGGR